MILVLASVVDAAARAFVEEFTNTAAASLVTCRDLAEGPMAFRHPDFFTSKLTVGGRPLAVCEIDGVINLLPAVFPEELFFYPPEEREYQAAEFHALLTFFLSALSCPVVNRPTPSALSGPCFNSIAWHSFAQRLGIPVSSRMIDTDDFTGFLTQQRREDAFEVSCLAGRVIEGSGTLAGRITLELSERANVEYLRAVYENSTADPRFITASAVPDVGNAATRAGLINLFARPPACG